MYWVRYRIVFLLGLLGLLLPVVSHSAIITASTCSRNDVQAAVNGAASGDTVNIPAGTCTYTSAVTVTDKSLRLVGAGSSTTILKSNWNGETIRFNCNSSITGIEVSGIYFLSNIPFVSQTVGTTGMRLQGSCQDYNIHENKFEKHSRSGLRLEGLQWGVVWGNTFFDNRENTNYPPGNVGYGVEVIGAGNTSWSRWPASPSAHMSEAAAAGEWVFVEDNTFTQNKHDITCNNGGRYVFRNNTSTETIPSTGAFDRHGFGAWPRGCRGSNIYNNVQNTTLNNQFAAMLIRGGDGVIYNNQIGGDYNDAIVIKNESSGANAQGSNCSYPCQDQIRRLHQWGNTINGQTATITVQAAYTTLLQSGRDYFNVSSAPADYDGPFTYPHPLRETEVLPQPSFSDGYILRTDPNTIIIRLQDPSGGVSVGTATGFTCRIDTVATTVSAASCATTSAQLAECSLTIADSVTSSSQAFDCSYSEASGNVLDVNSKELLAFTTQSIVNWYDKIFNPETIMGETTPDPGNPSAGLFDNDSVTESSSMVSTQAAPGEICIEFDLVNAFSLDAIIVVGDNTFNKQCETYSAFHKASSSDSYTTLFTGENCNTRTALTKTFASTSDRYWKVEFTDNRSGTSTGVQVFELDAVATAGGGDPPVDPTPITTNVTTGVGLIGIKLTP